MRLCARPRIVCSPTTCASRTNDIPDLIVTRFRVQTSVRNSGSRATRKPLCSKRDARQANSMSPYASSMPMVAHLEHVVERLQHPAASSTTSVLLTFGTSWAMRLSATYRFGRSPTCKKVGALFNLPILLRVSLRSLKGSAIPAAMMCRIKSL